MEELIRDAGYIPAISEERSTFRFIICNRELCSFLKGFGRYAIGKKLSGQCFNLEHERKKALYEGYFSADGYAGKNGAMQTTTISAELAAGIAQIARDVFHRPVSISKKNPERICVIDGRQVNGHPLYCVTVSPNERYGYYKDGFIWCLVKNIEHRYERRTVFNIGVKTDETYTANGIVVHNCQPFSVAGQRKGAEDNRYLWPHMLRAIHEVRPDWVIGENVAGILTMVQPGEETEVGSQSTLFSESEPVFKRRQQYVVETICLDLEREGYSVQPVLILACSVGAPHRRDRIWFIAHRNGPGLQAERAEQQPAGTAGDHPCDASSYSAGYGNTPSGEGPQMEAGPCAIPAQPAQWGKEAQRPERLSGLLRDAAAHSGSQRCRCGGCNGEKRQDYCDTEREDTEDQSERACLECRAWKDGRTSAHADGEGLEGCGKLGESGEERPDTGKEQPSRFLRPDWKEFPTQPPVCSRDDGFSARLDGITFSQ
ncbi:MULTISPECIES: DNA cytosine methyltransferase [Bacteroides]|uniref:DNA cytosine methyltransferase n=1 Tax=Bacteroides thetaiotaomicron TaxID=818 RepID=A0AA46U7K4_BACT4|nr:MULTISPECIES: DNA cytosine methyltransferase [Bacteroides]UVP43623.1 DNA cytosine methyltransferase [Bacteroides thetaiotaomicron]UYU69554.1 DNA cytosine methyltransferase [Bacteroides thetaiotaomicron]